MLKVVVSKLGNVAIFRCSGRITSADRDILHSALIKQNGVSTVVLDVAEIKRIDAGGLGLLLALRERVLAAGLRCKLMNVPPRLEALLQLTGLASIFEVFSLQEMFALLCSQGRPILEFPAGILPCSPEAA